VEGNAAAELRVDGVDIGVDVVVALAVALGAAIGAVAGLTGIACGDVDGDVVVGANKTVSGSDGHAPVVARRVPDPQ
jgi:hypothetical protein